MNDKYYSSEVLKKKTRGLWNIAILVYNDYKKWTQQNKRERL